MNDALDAALRFLSYRPRSEAEVRRRLSRRFSHSSVDNAMATLREQGLLDDAAFAQFWRQSRERNRPKGISAMRWELLRMGVSRDVADDALEGTDEDESAYRAASGISRRMGQADYDTFQKKLVPYLRRRGFGPETTRGAVHRLWSELSDTVHGDIYGEGHEQQKIDDVNPRGNK